MTKTIRSLQDELTITSIKVFDEIEDDYSCVFPGSPKYDLILAQVNAEGNYDVNIRSAEHYKGKILCAKYKPQLIVSERDRIKPPIEVGFSEFDGFGIPKILHKITTLVIK